jgi:hypothetical protein
LSVEWKMPPPFDYYLNESDPDIAVLRRQDGSFVAAFSAQGATRKGIVETAREDYGKLVEANVKSPLLREDSHQKRSA